MTSENGESPDKPNESGGERSRGRRRTAREIAQMFDQLKQRHLTRKKEWQAEREELMKRADLAEESQRVLGELKRILEDLKDQLCSEERKRKHAEEHYEREREEWRVEKAALLHMIDNLESRQSSGLDHEKCSLRELNSVKSQLLARERDLDAIRKSNSNFEKKFVDIQHNFEEEKRKLIEKHEGEKRNWEKTRQVMLDKIDLLHQENQSARSTFPLHGSHMTSPTYQVESFMTSSNTNNLLPEERKKEIQSVAKSQPNQPQDGAIVSSQPLPVKDIQQTVDAALYRIEKINQEYNCSVAGNKSNSLSSRFQNQPRQISSYTNVNKSAARLRSASFDHASRGSPKIKIPDDRKASVSSYDEISDVSKSPAYSCKEQKEIKERSLVANPLPESSKLQRQFVSSNRQSQPTPCSPEVTSPISESATSCSLPLFTESSADSPHCNSASNVQANLKNDNANESSFVKIEKHYSKSAAEVTNKKNPNASNKQLPNLHQTLLFGSASAKSKDATGTDISPDMKKNTSNFPKTPATNVRENHGLKVHTAPHLHPERGYNKQQVKMTHSPRLQRAKLECPTESTQASHSPKEKLGFSFHKSPSDTDFVQKENNENASFLSSSRSSRNKVSSEDFIGDASPNIDAPSLPRDVPPPPLRPKPSVTIEKDTEGNVLRVISDTKQPKLDPNSEQNKDHPLLKNRTSIFSEPSTNADTSPTYDKSPLVLSSVDTKSTGNRIDNAAELKTSKPQPRGNLSTRGKTWIKKHLSFLEKDDAAGNEYAISQDLKRNGKTKNKTRSSSLKRTEERKSLKDVSTSEESDDTKNREKFRRRRGRKETEDMGKSPKSRMKRYTRSKTDTPMEMKNLFSKFRATQFSSKKPSIVKQFERKLLENEVRLLEDTKEKKRSSIKGDNDSRRIEKVRGKVSNEEDDGYSGEDELEDQKGVRKIKNEVKGTLSVDRNSSKKKESFSKTYPKSRFHKSLTDLNQADDFIDSSMDNKQENKGRHKFNTSQSEEASEHYTHPLPASYQYIRTSLPTHQQKSCFASCPKSEFTRGAPGRYSLQERKDGNTPVKRLSWSKTTERNVPDPSNSVGGNHLPSQGLVDPIHGNDEKPNSTQLNSKVSIIVTKPEINISGSPSNENIVAASGVKPINRGYKNFKSIASNLEQVLQRGPTTPKSRRYQRSVTQPIAQFSTTSESESDEDQFRKKTTHNSSAEALAKESRNTTAPALTAQFKKPTMTNRRLPSRWLKKSEA